MQARQKQERIVEAVRLGLEGDAAIEFLCHSGYAMTSPAIARHLKLLGGRKSIAEYIQQGKSNSEVLHAVLPDGGVAEIPHQPPTQRELFESPAAATARPLAPHVPLYDTTKLTIRLPRDVYEAVRVAAKAENKPQNQLIVDILTSALSQMP